MRGRYPQAFSRRASSVGKAGTNLPAARAVRGEPNFRRGGIRYCLSSRTGLFFASSGKLQIFLQRLRLGLPPRNETAGDITRQQEVVAAARVHHAGTGGRHTPGAPEEIAAHGTLYGAPDILCHDKTPHTVGWRKTLIGFEPDRDAQRDESSVHREASLRRQHTSFSADRSIARQLAKEHIGGIFAAQRGSSRRVPAHPVADRHHRRLGTRHDTALDQQPSDRHIGLPILPVIADPDRPPTLEPNPARALDLKKTRVDRIVDPEEFEPVSGERAILDLGSGIASGYARLGRATVDRHLVTPLTLPRPVKLDLIISSEQPLARAVIGNSERDERRLEEPARRGIVLGRQRYGGLAQRAPCADAPVIRDIRPGIERR